MVEQKTTRRQRSPVCWFGGKSGMVKDLVPLIPKHQIYVEVFGGGASLLFAKETSPVEVYNDLDSGLVCFFRVLRDPEKFPRLLELCQKTPFSREEWDHCRKTWEESDDIVDRAHRWYVVARMSFSGIWGNSWGYGITKSSRGMAGCCSKWKGVLDELPMFHERIMRVQIDHSDFRAIFKRYDTPETVFYVDPPYVPETRKAGNYTHELTIADHADLVDILLRLQGKALLSGYAHEVYEPLEQAGWTRKDFQTTCRAAGRTRVSGLQGTGNVLAKQRRTESVWISPDHAVE